MTVQVLVRGAGAERGHAHEYALRADDGVPALPDAGLDQFDSPDTTLQALNARRIDTYLADQSAIRWLMKQFPGRYVDGGYGWMPNSYASAVKPGDPIWLNWVNTVYKEAMMGVDFDTFAESYKKWFDIDLPTPTVGFPQEFA